MVDLILAQNNRAKDTARNIKYFSSELIYKYMDTYNIPHDINISSIQDAIRESLYYLRKHANDKDNKQLLIPIINGLEEMVIPIDPDAMVEARYFSKYLHNLVEEYEDQNLDDDGDWQEIDFFDDYDSFIDQVANRLVILEVGEPMLKKYKKTRKRYNNVIDISWDNLSMIYKVYLLEQCSNNSTDEIQLYDISKTCNAYLHCSSSPSITKNSDCITNIQQEYLKKVDSRVF
jgi:hypothetical protein